MASPPYRAKLHASAMPPSSASRKTNSAFNVPKNSNPKENNAVDGSGSRSEGRASSRPFSATGKATALPKPMKKSFMSPTFSAASKAKRVLSERNDHTVGNSQWDRTPSRETANADPAMLEDDISKADNLVEAMEVDNVAERRQLPPFLEESHRQLQGQSEPPSLEELQRKVRRFLEENFPYRIRENAGNDNLPKDPNSPPYHPIHSPFSIRPEFVHVNGSPEGLLASDRGSDVPGGERGSCLPPYDPKKNYLSPRPQFLRYKPDRYLDLVPSLDMEMDGSRDGGNVEERSIRSEDFTGAQCEVVDEIEALERQIASVELDAEEKHGERNADEVCEDEAKAKETMSGSCLSSEPTMVEETGGASGICMFAPMFNIKEEFEESKDWDDMDRTSPVDLWRSIFMVIFAVFSASVVLLASGSSGLLPASLHDNALANLWQSSKFYSPTMGALRGTEGFWRRDLVASQHLGVNLQQHDYSDLRMKASGFCTSAKEIASRGFQNLKKFGGNFFSSSKIVEPFFLEDSVFPIGAWEENVPDILEEDDETSSFVPLSEYGDEEDNSGDLLGLSCEDQIHEEADRLAGSISPSESIEFERPRNMQGSYGSFESGNGLENSLEPSILPSEGHMHVEEDRVYGTVSHPESIGMESHPGMHSSYDIRLSSPQDIGYDGVEYSVEDLSDTSIFIESDILDTFSPKNSEKTGIPIDALESRDPENGNLELVPTGESDGFTETIHMESQPHVQDQESASITKTEIHGEPESSETFAMQNQEEMGRSSDGKVDSVPELLDTKIIPELVPMGEPDVSNLNGFSQTIHLEPYRRAHGSYEFVSSTETEAYGEPQSFENIAMQHLEPYLSPLHSSYEFVSSGEPESVGNFAMQNLEEMKISGDEEVGRVRFSTGDAETVDTGIPNENEFTVSAEFVMAQEQENREGESQLSGVLDLKPSEMSEDQGNREGESELLGVQDLKPSEISQEQENREGGSELSGVQDLKPSETHTSGIPRRSVRRFLLFGSMTASLLAAALAAIYLAYRSRKSSRNVDAEETSSREVQEETNHPRGNDYVTPSRIVGFYPRGHFSSSMQMNTNTPDENFRQWRASSVPRVELLHEYSPARASTKPEHVSNPWAASVSGENRFQTPERRVRRKSSLSSAISTPEMSVDTPSYGSFTTYDKVSDEEQVRITPVRRSSRIRNQTNSPYSGRGKPAK